MKSNHIQTIGCQYMTKDKGRPVTKINILEDKRQRTVLSRAQMTQIHYRLPKHQRDQPWTNAINVIFMCNHSQPLRLPGKTSSQYLVKIVLHPGVHKDYALCVRP